MYLYNLYLQFLIIIQHFMELTFLFKTLYSADKGIFLKSFIKNQNERARKCRSFFLRCYFFRGGVPSVFQGGRPIHPPPPIQLLSESQIQDTWFNPSLDLVQIH